MAKKNPPSPDTLEQQDAANAAAAGAEPAGEASPDSGEASPPDNTEIIGATMLGEMVKFVIDEIRAAPDVWAKMSQHQQDEVINRTHLRCTHIIGQVVNLIAADGREVIACDLESITAKDEIKAVCKLSKFDTNRHALLDAVGKRVLLVVAEPAPYLGGEIPKAAPDQPELPIADAGESEGAQPGDAGTDDAGDTSTVH